MAKMNKVGFYEIDSSYLLNCTIMEKTYPHQRLSRVLCTGNDLNSQFMINEDSTIAYFWFTYHNNWPNGALDVTMIVRSSGTVKVNISHDDDRNTSIGKHMKFIFDDEGEYFQSRLFDEDLVLFDNYQDYATFKKNLDILFKAYENTYTNTKWEWTNETN